MLADHVQPALGGEFLAPLGHQAHRVGLCGERNPQHVLGRRHLEIQRLRYLGLEAGHVAVADMAAVLTQMRGDAVGAGLDRGQRGAHRIRPLAAPRVAQGCDVIDIDSEAQRGNGHFGTRRQSDATSVSTMFLILTERASRTHLRDEGTYCWDAWFETALRASSP